MNFRKEKRGSFIEMPDFIMSDPMKEAHISFGKQKVNIRHPGSYMTGSGDGAFMFGPVYLPEVAAFRVLGKIK